MVGCPIPTCFWAEMKCLTLFKRPRVPYWPLPPKTSDARRLSPIFRSSPVFLVKKVLPPVLWAAEVSSCWCLLSGENNAEFAHGCVDLYELAMLPLGARPLSVHRDCVWSPLPY